MRPYTAARLIAALATFVAASPAALAWEDAAAPPRAVKLDYWGLDFAINPEAGDMVAIDPKEHRVALYRAAYFDGDRSAKVGPIQVGNKPSFVLYKKFKGRDLFAIACTGDTNLYLLDAKTLKQVGEIRVKLHPVWFLMSSQEPTDPFIYYTGQGERTEQLGRVDLAKMKDCGLLRYGETGEAISADGKTLYDRGGEVLSAFRIVEPTSAAEPFKLEDIAKVKRYTRRLYVDGVSRLLAAGKEIYSADLKAKLGEIEHPVKCFFPGRPIALAIADYESLIAASSNTFRTAGSVPLPPELLLSPASRRHGGADGVRGVDVRDGKDVHFYLFRVLADPVHRRVVLAYLDHAAVVPLEALRVPDEPLLYVRIDSPSKAFVEQPVTLTISRPDPKIDVNLEAAPPGARFSGDKIEWTPSAGQLGLARFELQLSRGETWRGRQSVEFNVTRRFARTPFDSKGISLRDDGEYAVAWRSYDGINFPEEGEPPTQLAVVRLDDLTVTAKTTLPVFAADVAVGRDRIFVAAREVAQLISLSLADLKDERVALIGEPVARLAAIGDSRLVASDGYSLVRQFRQNDLAEITPGLKRPKRPPKEDEFAPEHFEFRTGIQGRGFVPEVGAMRSQANDFARLLDGWWVDGIVYDESLSKVRMVADFRGLQGVGESVYILDEDELRGVPDFDTTILDGFVSREDLWQLQDRDGMLYAWLPQPGNDPDFSNDSKRRESSDDVGQENEKFIALRIMGLGRHDKRSRPVVALAKKKEYSLRDDKPRFAVVGRRAVVSLDDEVFAYDLPPAKPNAPQRLRFVPDQTVFLLADDKPVVLKHKVTGGRGPYRLSLLAGEHMKLDAKTGDVSVDSKKLREWLAGQMADFARDRGGAEYLNEYVRGVSAKFEQLLGRKPTGVPTVATVALSVKDAAGQGAKLAYQLVVDLDRKAIDAEMKKAGERGAREVFPPRRRAPRPRDEKPSDAPPDIEFDESKIPDAAVEDRLLPCP